MRFNESSCVKCRFQAVFKYASQCIVHASVCCSFKSFIPMIDIDCSFSISLFLSSFRFHCLSHISIIPFFSSLAFIVHLHGDCHHRIQYITYGLFWCLICAHQPHTYAHKCQPNSKPMPAIQWMRWWWSKTIQTDIIPEREWSRVSVCFKKNERQKQRASAEIKSEEKKLRTLTHSRTLYGLDEQDKIHKVFF